MITVFYPSIYLISTTRLIWEYFLPDWLMTIGGLILYRPSSMSWPSITMPVGRIHQMDRCTKFLGPNSLMQCKVSQLPCKYQINWVDLVGHFLGKIFYQVPKLWRKYPPLVNAAHINYLLVNSQIGDALRDALKSIKHDPTNVKL